MFMCICPIEFAGELCELKKSEDICDYINLCRNNATCVSNPKYQNGFTCVCQPEFQGELCDFYNPNPCDRISCANNGTCIRTDTESMFMCICPIEFFGLYCETKKTDDVCDFFNPCFNNATCVSNPKYQNGFTCVCQPGFNGEFCEIKSCIMIIFFSLSILIFIISRLSTEYM